MPVINERGAAKETQEETKVVRRGSWEPRKGVSPGK